MRLWKLGATSKTLESSNELSIKIKLNNKHVHFCNKTIFSFKAQNYLSLPKHHTCNKNGQGAPGELGFGDVVMSLWLQDRLMHE